MKKVFVILFTIALFSVAYYCVAFYFILPGMYWYHYLLLLGSFLTLVPAVIGWCWIYGSIEPKENKPLKNRAKFVCNISVPSPITGELTGLTVYQEEGVGMFAVESSYIEWEEEPVYSVFGNGELVIEE